MRRTLIAGNWKMNLNLQQSEALAKAVAESADTDSVDVALCPPSVYLAAVVNAVAGSKVAVGGQNMYHAAEGAYTGELSPGMLKDVGCSMVILGHSERRQLFGESNQDVCLKTHAALAAGLTPIVCVGETLQQREGGETSAVIREQFEGSLKGLTAEQVGGIVIAYEPVWAIGTGKVATPDQAEAVHADLRKLLETSYNAEIAASVRIQYGGSVKPDNAAELLAQPNIDGALVGGASLKADSFLGIISPR
ncbi:MAG: triose-phosphate isomerase [Planctomycetales bacterium]|nr:triose-phosphate isomerase [Planctomycetales bacterium]